MDYKIKELAELSGVSARTLRYYDSIGLLKAERMEENGYRIYGPEQVDRLQQILFYRRLGLPLEEIAAILSAADFDRQEALERHLIALEQQQEQLGLLIRNVKQTLRSLKGEINMSDKEKFEGFKKELIQKNQEQYGEEVAAKYGEDALTESNRKIAGMSEEQWQKQQELSDSIIALLKEAMAENDPACPAAQKAADCHRQWLCLFWKDGLYNKAVHRNMADMYAADERFTQYYDSRLGPGGTEFLRAAVYRYTE